MRLELFLTRILIEGICVKVRAGTAKVACNNVCLTVGREVTEVVVAVGFYRSGIAATTGCNSRRIGGYLFEIPCSD